MEQDLKIEEYKDLFGSITSLSDRMPEIIMLNYFDSNKFWYSLYHEAFNSIKQGINIIDVKVSNNVVQE